MCTIKPVGGVHVPEKEYATHNIVQTIAKAACNEWQVENAILAGSRSVTGDAITGSRIKRSARKVK